MSGIAGIIRFDGGPIEPGQIEGMAGAMAHRGPDGIQYWSRGPAAFAHCMLCTTPESLEETQPLTNEEQSLILVMDGRVDNWEELRGKLLTQNARLRTRADSELVLRAYECWGRDCLKHIDGDFALVIWDARRREAFCARDRFGAKPFFYHWNQSRLAFASEPSALFALFSTPRTLNEGIIAEYLADDWLSRDETVWRGILRLVAAHRIEVGPAGPRISRYWAPDLAREIRYKTQGEYVEHYRDLLFDAVRRCSRATGPLSCEVSGGLDSSGVYAVCEELRRTGRLLSPALDAYTLKFDDDTRANELDYARAVSAHWKSPIREIDPTLKSLDWHRDFARKWLTLPLLPNGLMHHGIHAAVAESDGRVILTGIGGDEWLWGDRAYYAELIERRDFSAVRECLLSDARAMGWRKSLWRIFRFGLYPLAPERVRAILRWLLAGKAHQGDAAPDCLSAELRDQLRARRNARPGSSPCAVSRRGQSEQLRTLERAVNAHAREAMENLAAMQGIELRAPLFALPLVEFSFATEERRRHCGGVNRVLHREALRGLLPETVRERASKAEFSSVFSIYRRDLCDARFLRDPRSCIDWVDSGALAQLQAAVNSEDEGDLSVEGARAMRALWMNFSCSALAAEI